MKLWIVLGAHVKFEKKKIILKKLKVPGFYREFGAQYIVKSIYFESYIFTE